MKHKESAEQQAYLQWCEAKKVEYPELALEYHTPNGGRRDVREAARLKREGVKAGVPDITLPVPRGGYHGLYIELKAEGGRVTDNQFSWIHFLESMGYYAVVCFGWRSAAKTTENSGGVI